MEITVKAEVCPTEDKEKVKKAISNLFSVDIFEETKEGRTYLIGVGKSRESLERFYTLIRSQCILDTARKIFETSTEGDAINFELNKQASYMGAINFYHGVLGKSIKSSQLNKITVKIVDAEIKELIDWMAPSTI